MYNHLKKYVLTELRELRYPFLILITFNLLWRLILKTFINGDLYVWKNGSVNRGLIRSSSIFIEKLLHSNAIPLNSYLFSSITYALGFTFSIFIGYLIFKILTKDAFISAILISSIVLSPAGISLFHNIYVLNSWIELFYSGFCILSCIIISINKNRYDNNQYLGYQEICIFAICIFGSLYREFVSLEVCCLLFTLSISCKKSLFRLLTRVGFIFNLIILTLSLFLPSDNVQRSISASSNTVQLFFQNGDLFFLVGLILSLIIIITGFSKVHKLFFTSLILGLIGLLLYIDSNHLGYLYIFLSLTSLLFIEVDKYKQLKIYLLLVTLGVTYGLWKIESSNGHYIHLLLPLFTILSLQLYWLKSRSKKYFNYKNVISLLVINAILVFGCGLNGLRQTAYLISTTDNISLYITNYIKEEQKSYSNINLYGNPYYLNDIGIKNDNLNSFRCKDTFNSDDSTLNLVLIHEPNRDCGIIYKNSDTNNKLLKTFEYQFNNIYPSLILAKLSNYNYSSYLPNEWVSTFPIDINKKINKYIISLYKVH